MLEIRKGNGPLYLAICDAIAREIAEGWLKPGAKLPPHRDLAYKLKVTVGTVARAYSEAATRGLIVGEVGRGTFVNNFDNHGEETTRLVVEEQSSTEVIDLGLNLSAIGEAEEMLRSTLRDLSRLNSVSSLLKYQPAAGMISHRLIASKWLERFGIKAQPDNIVICNGGQHGLLLAMMAVAGHGESIATEALTYPGAKAIAHQLGIHLNAVSMDGEGLDADSLRELCETRRPKAIYCMPVLQNPTTITMPENRVREIAAVAEKYGLWIIEDDVYGFLAETRPSALASLLPEQTIYVTSASKCMAPGLRVGFIVAPPKLCRIIQELSTMTDWMSPPLMAEIVSNWIMTGQADRLIEWHRHQASDRQRLAHRILRPYAENTSMSCYHLWMRLPEPWRMDSFAAAALKVDVRVITADAFAVKRDHAPHAVRLCLGATHTLQQIGSALERLKQLAESKPRPLMDLQMIS